MKGRTRTGVIALLRKGHQHKELTKKQKQQLAFEQSFDVKCKVRY